MTRARQDRLMSLLLAAGGWSTAASLADRLGVTPRSIRSYVVAANGRVGGGAVESGPLGYRAGPDAAAALRAHGAAPGDRARVILRSLLASPDGVDLAGVAGELHVSAATVDVDLARVRGMLAGSELALVRTGARVRLTGPERAQRRLVSRLVHDELDASAVVAPDDLRRALGDDAVGAAALAAFRDALVTGLGDAGYEINELGVADVMLHVGIAVDRIAHDRPIESESGLSPGAEPIGELVDELATRHLGIRLGAADRDHLAALVATRVAARTDDARARLDPAVESAVRGVVGAAAEEFGLDLVDDDFVLRLALHVQNLLARSQTLAWSRNPLTASLKATHPMVFEIAVHVAGGLRERLGIPLPDDEIAYIAMHIGGRLERGRGDEPRPRAAVVSPGYLDLPELLRSGVDRALGRVVEVTEVVTRADPDWASIDADLVLTTIEPPIADERMLRITPFLTDADVARVQAAAARIRRARRLARLRDELGRYLDAATFVRGVAGDPEEVIRRLGGLLVAEGVIDEAYVEGAIERERLSPTAFTDALAVPHAMSMTATRTAIAIGIAEPAIAWGSEHVQVVAMVAFSESDRTAFQTVLEQFVEVFAEPGGAQRIIRRASTFAGFVDELAAVIDG